MKESVQKMNGRKKYVGELYSFYRENRPIGKGGNGAVYEVEILSNNGLEFPMVAKFFEYEGTDKVIILGLSEPPVRTLRATIPENGSHIFR